MSVSFKVNMNDKPIKNTLGEARRRGQDLTPAHEEIGAAMVVSTQMRFEKEAGPDGAKWPQSIRAKVEQGKTLVETARLKNSQTYKATPGSVAWGTNVVYALIHQLGGVIKQAARKAVLLFNSKGRFISEKSARSRKKVFGVEADIGPRQINMPARPFLGMDQDDERAIVKTYEHYIGVPLQGGAQ